MKNGLGVNYLIWVAWGNAQDQWVDIIRHKSIERLIRALIAVGSKIALYVLGKS